MANTSYDLRLQPANFSGMPQLLASTFGDKPAKTSGVTGDKHGVEKYL